MYKLPSPFKMMWDRAADWGCISHASLTSRPPPLISTSHLIPVYLASLTHSFAHYLTASLSLSLSHSTLNLSPPRPLSIQNGSQAFHYSVHKIPIRLFSPRLHMSLHFLPSVWLFSLQILPEILLSKLYQRVVHSTMYITCTLHNAPPPPQRLKRSKGTWPLKLGDHVLFWDWTWIEEGYIVQGRIIPLFSFLVHLPLPCRQMSVTQPRLSHILVLPRRCTVYS